jgi:hypothetical protein
MASPPATHQVALVQASLPPLPKTTTNPPPAPRTQHLPLHHLTAAPPRSRPPRPPHQALRHRSLRHRPGPRIRQTRPEPRNPRPRRRRTRRRHRVRGSGLIDHTRAARGRGLDPRQLRELRDVFASFGGDALLDAAALWTGG